MTAAAAAPAVRYLPTSYVLDGSAESARIDLGPDRDAWGPRDWSVLACLTLFAVAVPALLAGATHSLTIPRIDDWAYRSDLSRFITTGHFRLDGWGAMTLTGQLLWSAPFVLVLGDHSWVPGLTVAVLSVAGVIASYWLARQLLSRFYSAFCLLLVALFPGFLLNTTSYMTDAPTFACEMVSLALGAWALRQRAQKHLAALATASMAAGCFGFSIREFAAAAPVAVASAGFLIDRPRRLFWLLTAVATLGTCGLIYLWSHRLLGAQPTTLGLPGRATAAILSQIYFTVAFALSPLIPLVLRRYRFEHPLRAAIAAGIALFVGYVTYKRSGGVFVGNYLGQVGAGGELLPGWKPLLLGQDPWRILNALALVSGAGVAAMATRLFGGSGAILQPVAPAALILRAFALLTAVGLLIYALFAHADFFDRYLWSLLLAIALVTASGLRHPGRPRLQGHSHHALSAGLFSVVLVVCSLFTLSADSLDGAARSAGAEAARVTGAPATSTDAGFAWVGAHYAGPVVAKGAQDGKDPYNAWYLSLFPRFVACTVVSVSPLDLPRFLLVGRVTYERFALVGPESLYIYRVKELSCEIPAWRPAASRGKQGSPPAMVHA